jgi:uncharacterized protein (DUF427 family)
MKIPSPDHPIAIKPAGSRVVVVAGGKVIAESVNAMALKEASYPTVLYIPREDVDITQLTRTDKASYCPYKGDCSYFSIPAGGTRADNAVWSYEAPYDAAIGISGHLAFYPDRVDLITETALA